MQTSLCCLLDSDEATLCPPARCSRRMLSAIRSVVACLKGAGLELISCEGNRLPKKKRERGSKREREKIRTEEKADRHHSSSVSLAFLCSSSQMHERCCFPGDFMTIARRKKKRRKNRELRALLAISLTSLWLQRPSAPALQRCYRREGERDGPIHSRSSLALEFRLPHSACVCLSVQAIAFRSTVILCHSQKISLLPSFFLLPVLEQKLRKPELAILNF